MKTRTEFLLHSGVVEVDIISCKNLVFTIGALLGLVIVEVGSQLVVGFFRELERTDTAIATLFGCELGGV